MSKVPVSTRFRLPMRVSPANRFKGFRIPRRLGWALVFALMMLGVGAGAHAPMQGIDREFAGATGKLWSKEREQELDRAAHDGNPATFAVVTPESRETEVRVGLEWATRKRLSGLKVVYASLNGAAYEPLPDFQFLEFWNGQEWRKLGAQVIVNYGRIRESAAYQNSGSVVWDYQFPPSEMKGVRALLSKTVSSVRWEQRYAIRELQPYATEQQRIVAGQTIIVDDSGKLEATGRPGRSLAADAKRSRDDKGTVLSWSRPKMLSDVTLPLADLPGPLEWWDGQKWRNLEITRKRKHSGPLPQTTATFLPIAVQRLRLSGLTQSTNLEVTADSSQDYFNRVYSSGRDLLMERLLQSPDDPDFAAVSSLLLPLDMQTSVIGRPGDPVECIVHWNGTIVEVESGDQGAWNHGAKQTIPGKDKWVDRWCAFAADGELFGTNVHRTGRSYLDGFMPGVLTRYSKDEIEFEEEVFTTAPDDPLYAQAVTLRVSNPGATARKARFSLVMGRRQSAVAGHRSPVSGPSLGPLGFEPLDTSYRLEPDCQVVRNASGEVVLYAEQPFTAKGSALEHVLDYSVELAPKGSKEFHFVLPSVNKPVKERADAARWNPKEGRERFRRYWTKTLQGNTDLKLPEKPLSDLCKNLLAQAMIVLSDGDTLKYGAYWYEWYFGVEEGWPITALAQFGHPQLAKRAMEVMLSPQLMVKSNYHHQYRSGLAPMYAAQVYRLTRDREWLRKISPDLKASAEWIIQARHQPQGKLPDYEGLLPRHAYGGDIHTPAYSIYSNATCWRGLQDTAYLFGELGDRTLAEKYANDAAAYRRRVEETVAKFTNRESQPPFVPLALDIGDPTTPAYRKVESPYPFIPSDPLGNFWNLFAPLMLETGVFPADSQYARWITDFMEQRGGLLAGLARFYRGVDHIYGFAYPLQLHDRGDRRKFLATVYSVLAHGNSQDNFTSPEVAGVFPLRTDNGTWEHIFRRSLWNWDLYGSGWMQEEFGKAVGAEPLSAGAGMGLQLVRKMVFDENLDRDGRMTGELDLLKMAPSHWLEAGKKIEFNRMPTCFGEMSLRLESQLNRGKIVGQFTAPSDQPAKTIRLWLRHPQGIPIKAVAMNRIKVRDFTAESVLLPVSGGMDFEVEF